MNEKSFIVIEGNIGAGKTTLSKMIAEKYNAKLILERFADNAFLPKFYKEPDRYSFPLELSFLADRYNQLKKDLVSRDLFSPFIIADYYFMKSLIFAQSTLGEDEYNLYRQLFNIIYQQLPKPDLYVYLHVEVDRLLENIKKRGREYESDISADYLHSIQKSYFDFFKQQPKQTFLVLDVNSVDFVANTEQFEMIRKLVVEGEYTAGIHREIL